MSATDYNPWGVAWEIDKAAARAGRKGYRMAQTAGMHYQNWKHKGTSDGGVQIGGTLEVPSAAVKKGAGKNWTTDEEKLENTTTSHTTYTRKRTR